MGQPFAIDLLRTDYGASIGSRSCTLSLETGLRYPDLRSRILNLDGSPHLTMIRNTERHFPHRFWQTKLLRQSKDVTSGDSDVIFAKHTSEDSNLNLVEQPHGCSVPGATLSMFKQRFSSVAKLDRARRIKLKFRFNGYKTLLGPWRAFLFQSPFPTPILASLTRPIGVAFTDGDLLRPPPRRIAHESAFGLDYRVQQSTKLLTVIRNGVQRAEGQTPLVIDSDRRLGHVLAVPEVSVPASIELQTQAN